MSNLDSGRNVTGQNGLRARSFSMTVTVLGGPNGTPGTQWYQGAVDVPAEGIIAPLSGYIGRPPSLTSLSLGKG